MMKMTHDKEADAAYMYFKNKIKAGEVKLTVEVNESLMFDYDDKKSLSE